MATKTPATPRKLRVEFYRDEAEAHRWRLTSSNGRIIATSGEGYRRRADAERAFESVGAGALGAVVATEAAAPAPAPKAEGLPRPSAKAPGRASKATTAAEATPAAAKRGRPPRTV